MQNTERNVLLFLAGLIVFLFVALFWSQQEIKKDFEQECNRLNGKAIWDGRQYQCLK